MRTRGSTKSQGTILNCASRPQCGASHGWWSVVPQSPPRIRYENRGFDKIVGNDFELLQQAAMRREPWMVKRSPSAGTTDEA